MSALGRIRTLNLGKSLLPSNVELSGPRLGRPLERRVMQLPGRSHQYREQWILASEGSH